LLIDTTGIAHLRGPSNLGQCHVNFAEGCHLYIAATPNGQQTDIPEHRGEPPPDYTGSGMAFLAPGGDNRKLSRDDRVIDRHHLGEGEGRAEDLDPSVERLSPPLPGFLDAAAVL
jgi:hypothetical protein